MRDWIWVFCLISLLLGSGITLSRSASVQAQDDPVAGIPVVAEKHRHRIEKVRQAWNESRWEDALLELLFLPEEARELARPDNYLSSQKSFSLEIRDRCWRHFRDRMAALDRRGGSVAMQDLYPRFQRIPVVCAAAGIEPPQNVKVILDRWRRKIDRRAHCDAVFYQADQLLLTGDEIEAIGILDPLVRQYSGDLELAADVDSVRIRLIERARFEIQQARELNQSSLVLKLADDLNRLCPGDPQAEEMERWALGRISQDAAQLLDSHQTGTALLQLARLFCEGEPVAEKLAKLRQEIVKPLLPRIIRDRLSAPLQQKDLFLLLMGQPLITIDKKDEIRTPSVHFGEVGRRWTRSPAHIADVKRWEVLIGEIQRLSALWLQASPQESILIYRRLAFHGSEAWRISRRLCESAGQRSRGVWEEWEPVYSGERWRVSGNLPVWLIDEKGREIVQSIDLHVDLSPSDLGRGGLPVTQAEIEQAEQKILGSMDRELVQLTHQIAHRRLLSTLQQARDLAQRGNLVAAQELLVPALLGSHELDLDLQRQAAAELVRWSRLDIEAVEVAIGRSLSP